MAGERTVQIVGRARPSGRILRAMTILHGTGSTHRMNDLVQDEVAVDAFARLLTEKIEKNMTKDGRLDMRDVAADVLREMKRNSK